MPDNISDQLTKGSHYKVRSFTTREEVITTNGYFKGYVQIGNHHALKMELDESQEDEGMVRIIPYHTIVQIDVIEEVESEETDKSEKSNYFG